MEIKFLLLITFTILINNSFPLQQVENQSRSIKILLEEKTNETKSINETTRLINNSYANEVTVNKTRSSVKGKNGKMGMMSSLPLALIFGAKAIFFKKILIGSILVKKCCNSTTIRPTVIPFQGVRPNVPLDGEEPAPRARVRSTGYKGSKVGWSKVSSQKLGEREWEREGERKRENEKERKKGKKWWWWRIFLR